MRSWIGAPGTIVEGAEKPVMRADVRVRRERVVVRREVRRIVVGVVVVLRIGRGLSFLDLALFSCLFENRIDRLCRRCGRR